MKIYFSLEQIIERIKAQSRPSKYITRDQIRWRILGPVITNSPKRPKNVVWSQAKK